MTIDEAAALKRHMIIHFVGVDYIKAKAVCHIWRIRAKSRIWLSRPGTIDIKVIWLGRTQTLKECDLPFIHLEKDCPLKLLEISKL